MRKYICWVVDNDYLKDDINGEKDDGREDIIFLIRVVI